MALIRCSHVLTPSWLKDAELNRTGKEYASQQRVKRMGPLPTGVGPNAVFAFRDSVSAKDVTNSWSRNVILLHLTPSGTSTQTRMIMAAKGRGSMWRWSWKARKTKEDIFVPRGGWLGKMPSKRRVISEVLWDQSPRCGWDFHTWRIQDSLRWRHTF